MSFGKSKTDISIVAFLVLTFAVTLIALPNANAQSTIKTYAYIGAVPNPVGVGQPTLIHVGVTLPLQSVEMGWEGLSVTITRPDGVTETIKDIRTDSTGGTGVQYTPTMAGNYTLQTHFPQQNTTSTKRARGVAVGTVALASDSEKLTLIVQEEPIEYYPGHPLPSEYWTRPIDAQLREWYTLAGSWLYTPDNLYAPYNEGPETAHILWAKPLTTGGLVGGDVGLEESINQGPVGMENGDAYEGKWNGAIILAGKLYYRTGAYDRPRLWYCVDLRTGEELWAKTFLDNQSIAFGQLYYWQSYNYMGTFAYLWVTVGTTWTAFDAFTGEWMATITDVPSGSTVRDSNGALYRLNLDLRNGWMALWNMSAFISTGGSWGSAFSLREYNASSGTYRSWQSNGSLGAPVTTGAAERAARAWSWNITNLPKNIPGSVRAIKFGDKVVGASITTTAVNMWAFSLKAGQIGTLIYNKTWNAPADWAAGNQTITWLTASFIDKVAVIFATETRQHYGFSLETGDYLWGPTTPPQHYLDALDDTKAGANCIAYGRMYSASVSGIVYCYNVTTGERLWVYEAVDPYTEILWANTWWMRPLFITDGKVYVGHYEHSANQPLPRGAPGIICLNATTGEVIWRADGLFRQTRWGGRAIIGDSVIATMDTYDQRVYAIGKGPSAITVVASPKVAEHGNRILVEGSVIDISPGTQDASIKLRFPNGVPVVADTSMSEWMLYVYKQFEKPANVKGVEVTVTVLDPNGNCYDVATATTDSNGFFSCTFEPPVPGKYTIITLFKGSKAYWGSSAETAVFVNEAPPPTPEATPSPQAPVETYFAVSTAAIIIAIAVVGILLLRKK
ncbi:MAG: hypothetical protein ACPLIG_05010 [Candidatus Bathyarchaeales archaeon]